LGAVIRDHYGDVQAVRSFTHMSLVELVVAEAMAARMANQLARDFGLEQIQMEGDAKVVVEGWDMSFVSRTSNKATHTTARIASTQVLDDMWTCEFPECIRAIIDFEKSALNV
jgi:ribonuclease HI